MSVDISKILLIGIPETCLNIIFCLLIWKGREAFKVKSNIWKIPLVSILLPSLIFIAKLRISSITIQHVFVILIATVAFSYFWKINKRCSFLISVLITLMILILETASMQFMSELINSTIEEYGFLHIKALLKLTMPTRIVQVIIVSILYKSNFSFKNNRLLFSNWGGLKKSEKVTIHILFRHLFVAIILSSSYTEIFLILKSYNIPIYLIRLPQYIAMFSSIYFLLSSLQLLMRQTLLEDLKNIFFQGPSKLFKNMLEASDETQILDYKLQLDNKLKEKGEIVK